MPTAAGLHYILHDDSRSLLPPVLLIHDVAGDHLSWPAELRRLPARSVAALDLPGHGRSAGPGRQSVEALAGAVEKSMDGAGFNRVVLAGHGLGGAVAQVIALDSPERVAGLVLVSTGPFLPLPASILANASCQVTHPLAINGLVEHLSGVHLPPAMKEALKKRLASIRWTLLLDDLLACNRFNVLDRLGSIHAPVLVVCGTADRFTPLHLSEILAAKIPAAALQTVDGAGHLLPREQPQRLAKLIGVFLATQLH